MSTINQNQNPTREEIRSYLDAVGKPYTEEQFETCVKYMGLISFPVYEDPKKHIHPITGKKTDLTIYNYLDSRLLSEADRKTILEIWEQAKPKADGCLSRNGKVYVTGTP
jgi:hypothetical protein